MECFERFMAWANQTENPDGFTVTDCDNGDKVVTFFELHEKKTYAFTLLFHADEGDGAIEVFIQYPTPKKYIELHVLNALNRCNKEYRSMSWFLGEGFVAMKTQVQQTEDIDFLRAFLSSALNIAAEELPKVF